MTRPDPPTRLQPARALVHPLWVAALLLLLANDHLFKAALHSPLTGKLSDVVGLLVAPALLAALLGVRTRWGLAAAHLATGAGLALINLSPEVAGLVEAASRLTPFPWRITVDPTDLLALPALLLSWRVLGRAMARPRPVARPALALALLAGSLACMATSQVEEPLPQQPAFFPPVQASLLIGNDSNAERLVAISPLRDTVWLDCDLAAADPTAALSRQLFEAPTLWRVEPGRVAPILGPAAGGCAAFLVRVDGGAPALVFFDASRFPAATLASTVVDAEPGRLISLRAGEVALDPHPAIFPAPAATDPPAAPGCEAGDPAAALAWSDDVPEGSFSLDHLSSSAGGCHALDLVSLADTGFVPPTRRFHLCVPPEAFPFEAGDALFIRRSSLGHDFQPVAGLEIVGEHALMRLARGSEPVATPGATLTVSRHPTCAGTHVDCGALALPLQVQVSWGATSGATLVAGQRADSGGPSRSFHLISAVELPIGDSGCLPAGLSGTRLIESVYTEKETSR